MSSSSSSLSMNNNNNSFSNNELRQNLQNTIKKSGILNEIKAHIRKDIILQLMTRENKNLRSLSHIKSDFHSRILQSIVHHYLQTNNLLKTISVFEAEFGIENHRNILSETEITDFLRLKYAIDDTDQVNTDGSILDKIVRSSMKEYNSTRREKELSFSTIHTESRQKHDNSEQALKQQISLLKSQFRSEKARASSLAFRCDELQNLVEDQKRAIEALSSGSSQDTRKSFSRKLLESHGNFSRDATNKSSAKRSFRTSIPQSTDPVEILAKLKGSTQYDVNRILSDSRQHIDLTRSGPVTSDVEKPAHSDGISLEPNASDIDVEVRHFSRVSPSSKSALQSHPSTVDGDS